MVLTTALVLLGVGLAIIVGAVIVVVVVIAKVRNALLSAEDRT